MESHSRVTAIGLQSLSVFGESTGTLKTISTPSLETTCLPRTEKWPRAAPSAIIPTLADREGCEASIFFSVLCYRIVFPPPDVEVLQTTNHSSRRTKIRRCWAFLSVHLAVCLQVYVVGQISGLQCLWPLSSQLHWFCILVGIVCEQYGKFSRTNFVSGSFPEFSMIL